MVLLLLESVINLDVNLTSFNEGCGNQWLHEPCDRSGELINLQEIGDIKVVHLFSLNIDELNKEVSIVLIGDGEFTSI